ncbi:HlyD family secretion protein [Tardiphaga sp. P9-11]|uniref:HlyD family secretion protein n=1 Tax=Tardiphaga sp. P9-11 TaxID=2024614 RepID=UPI001FEDC04B|nr:HlyD family secretion protein [Tardiphaga sp. P9-11]
MNIQSPSLPVGSPLSPATTRGALPGTGAAEAAAGKGTEQRQGTIRRIMLAGAALAVVGGISLYGWDYWTTGRFLISTDDAYVKSDNTTVSPKVSGYLSEVFVGDNEHVKLGQLLARIDDRDFKVAVDQAAADMVGARAAIAAKQAQLDVQEAVINAAQATLDVDRATLTFAAQDSKRYSDLATTGSGSLQNAQQAQSRIASAQAVMARDAANLVSAEKQVDLLRAEIAQANATHARAVASHEQALLNLSYTSIVAPVDGTVGNRSLRSGQYVQAGTQLMSVVPLHGAYVVANYKETQLTEVRKGQTVSLEVDMFPGQTVHGHVDSIAPASGQEFALLPPDNATGNFTKVVQRIPVKITLDDGNSSLIQLRPGMSVIPTIETHTAFPTIPSR